MHLFVRNFLCRVDTVLLLETKTPKAQKGSKGAGCRAASQKNKKLINAQAKFHKFNFY